MGLRLRDRAAAVRRAVLRRRRPLAVLLTAAAVALGLRAAVPPPPAATTVVVAARDLPAGAPLAADDLTTVDLPPDAVPEGVVADPAGSVLAAPVRRGEPVTDRRLVGPGLVADAPGTVALPVRLSDAEQAGLLDVGDRVDLLATDPQAGTTTTVTTDVLVLALPHPDAAAADALTGRLVVLGVPSVDLLEVSTAAVTAFVTFAWAGD